MNVVAWLFEGSEAVYTVKDDGENVNADEIGVISDGATV